MALALIVLAVEQQNTVLPAVPADMKKVEIVVMHVHGMVIP